tara:strand:+ start:97 stop:1245 length:1149 start_codon:yes stop_codon:yes gene_type:complete
MLISNLRLILALILCLLIFSIFFINNQIVSSLYSDRKHEITQIVQTYIDKLNSNNPESGLYAARELAPIINFPILFEFNNTASAGFNLEKEFYSYNKHELLDIKNKMASIFNPQYLINNSDTIGKVYYGISKSENLLINRIKLLPALEICFIILLSYLLYLQTRLSINSNRNKIYATMAKETAHQLGTPISSLLGWSEIIKGDIKREKYNHIINDIHRLKDISNRFGKIGDKPLLTRININKVVLDVIDYYKTKIPSSTDIQIIYLESTESYIQGDSTLLFWAFENLIKNSIDSMTRKGKITIKQENRNNFLYISFLDNGKGIQKRIINKIFKPGFSTKPNNWGIGLTLTKRIISEIHNSKFYLAKSSKEGTEFRVIFKEIT